MADENTVLGAVLLYGSLKAIMDQTRPDYGRGWDFHTLHVRKICEHGIEVAQALIHDKDVSEVMKAQGEAHIAWQRGENPDYYKPPEEKANDDFVKALIAENKKLREAHASDCGGCGALVGASPELAEADAYHDGCHKGCPRHEEEEGD